MNKKAQITILVIVAVVVVGAVLVTFAIKTKSSSIPKLQTFNDPEINQINQEIQNCVEQRALDAIYLIGLQGGYTHLPESHISSNLFNIAYGLKNKKNTLPSILKIEEEIEEYLNIMLPFCLDLETYSQLNITQQNPESDINIKDDKVKISTIIKTSIQKNERSYELDHPYETEIPIRLGKIHKTAKEIINKHLEDPNYIDLTYLNLLEFNVMFLPFEDKTIIYTLTDEESTINEISYSFMFGIEK
jgi:hypothetical protein